VASACLEFCEPVECVELGVPRESGARPHAALVVVGRSCRAWVYRLNGGAGVNTAAAVALEAGVVVPVGSLGAGRPRLAALAVWEHLCCCWTELVSWRAAQRLQRRCCFLQRVFCSRSTSKLLLFVAAVCVERWPVQYLTGSDGRAPCGAADGPELRLRPERGLLG